MSPCSTEKCFVTDDGAETDLDLVLWTFSSISILTNIPTWLLVKSTVKFCVRNVVEIPWGNCSSHSSYYRCFEKRKKSSVPPNDWFWCHYLRSVELLRICESLPFLEALRQRADVGADNVMYIHNLSCISQGSWWNENKPTQHSVRNCVDWESNVGYSYRRASWPGIKNKLSTVLWCGTKAVIDRWMSNIFTKFHWTCRHKVWTKIVCDHLKWTTSVDMTEWSAMVESRTWKTSQDFTCR